MTDFKTENGYTVSCYYLRGEYLLEVWRKDAFSFVDCPAEFTERPYTAEFLPIGLRGKPDYGTQYICEFSHIQAGGLTIDRVMMVKMIGLDGLAFIEQQATKSRNEFGVAA